MHYPNLLAALLLYLIPLQPIAAKSPPPLPQDLEMLREMAHDYASSHIQIRKGDRAEIEIGHLDSRLRLRACREGLEAFSPPGARYPGNSTVGVRCAGPVRWKVYVPGKIKLMRKVLVASRYLAKGHKLRATDMDTDIRDIAKLRRGYLQDGQALIGQTLRRSRKAGDLLTPSNVRQATLIRRGEQLQLVIRGGGLTVTAKAKALADGVKGQSIAVKNLRSNKRVDAIVEAHGMASLSL